MTLKRLGDMPLIGNAEIRLGDGLRSFSYRSHRIYYRVAEQPVLIVRILHHAQDAHTTLRRVQ